MIQTELRLVVSNNVTIKEMPAEGTDGGMTYKQVADVMGLTPEGVRQIEIRALRKLRANAKIMRAIRAMLDGRD